MSIWVHAGPYSFRADEVDFLRADGMKRTLVHLKSGSEFVLANTVDEIIRVLKTGNSPSSHVVTSANSTPPPKQITPNTQLETTPEPSSSIFRLYKPLDKWGTDKND